MLGRRKPEMSFLLKWWIRILCLTPVVLEIAGDIVVGGNIPENMNEDQAAQQVLCYDIQCSGRDCLYEMIAELLSNGSSVRMCTATFPEVCYFEETPNGDGNGVIMVAGCGVDCPSRTTVTDVGDDFRRSDGTTTKHSSITTQDVSDGGTATGDIGRTDTTTKWSEFEGLGSTPSWSESNDNITDTTSQSSEWSSDATTEWSEWRDEWDDSATTSEWSEWGDSGTTSEWSEWGDSGTTKEWSEWGNDGTTEWSEWGDEWDDSATTSEWSEWGDSGTTSEWSEWGNDGTTEWSEWGDEWDDSATTSEWSEWGDSGTTSEWSEWGDSGTTSEWSEWGDTGTTKEWSEWGNDGTTEWSEWGDEWDDSATTSEWSEWGDSGTTSEWSEWGDSGTTSEWSEWGDPGTTSEWSEWGDPGTTSEWSEWGDPDWSEWGNPDITTEFNNGNGEFHTLGPWDLRRRRKRSNLPTWRKCCYEDFCNHGSPCGQLTCSAAIHAWHGSLFFMLLLSVFCC